MLIALTGDKDTSQLDMRQLAEYKLRTRLLAIPGVGQVTVLGGRLPEYQVIYDPNKLKLAGVDLSSLKTAIQESPIFRPRRVSGGCSRAGTPHPAGYPHSQY